MGKVPWTNAEDKTAKRLLDMIPPLLSKGQRFDLVSKLRNHHLGKQNLYVNTNSSEWRNDIGRYSRTKRKTFIYVRVSQLPLRSFTDFCPEKLFHASPMPSATCSTSDLRNFDPVRVQKSSPVIPGGWHPWKREERKFGGLFSVQPELRPLWLESKKRIPEYVSQKPANLGLRSQ